MGNGRPGKGREHYETSADWRISQRKEHSGGKNGLILPRRGTVLLECLCNLLDNELFPQAGAPVVSGAVEKILKGLENISNQCEHLLVVTNEVGSDWPGYSLDILAYRNALGHLNILTETAMDAVVEVVAGVPVLRRGARR